MPQPSLNLVPTIHQAITGLLTTYEPEFLRFGYQLFLAFATILIAWQGIRMMFAGTASASSSSTSPKLLFGISFGYALLLRASRPRASASRTVDNVVQHLDALAAHFLQPDAWSILANLLYWTILLLIALAKALSLAGIAFGLIAAL